MSHTTAIKSVPIRDIAALHAAVGVLQNAGVRCSLVANAVPRMYYADQLQRHMGRKNEVADFVLKLTDAAYDVAFLRQEDGTCQPVFDDFKPWNGKAIKEFLGIPISGPEQHWSGQKEENDDMTASIAKLLQPYSMHAAINAAVGAGYTVENCYTDDNGEIQMTLG